VADNANPNPSGRSRWLKGTAIGFSFVAVVGVAALWYCGFLDGNFREVSAGKVYRSGQLDEDGFKDAIQMHGIKSIVNLRGSRKTALWYSGEKALCAAENVDHADIDIGLGELPSPEVLRDLVEKFESGPYPMLIHCRSGADRTALAATLYQNIVEKRPLDEAMRAQVSWRYGHFAVGKAKSIDEFFSLYKATAHGQNLKDWLHNTYPAEYAKRATHTSLAD